jgi:hypothetical protein
MHLVSKSLVIPGKSCILMSEAVAGVTESTVLLVFGVDLLVKL